MIRHEAKFEQTEAQFDFILREIAQINVKLDASWSKSEQDRFVISTDRERAQFEARIMAEISRLREEFKHELSRRNRE